MTWARERFLIEAARTGLFSPDYAEDVLVRLAHHSSAIEGNTITLGETVTLLVDELSPPGRSIREVYEVANHREGLVVALRAITDDEPLTEQLVREMHASLMDHLVADRGEYKSSGNAIVGATFTPTPPERVPEAMRQWAEQASWQTRSLDGAPLLEAIAGNHILLERIHPFSDGNGRTGRIVVAYQTIVRFGAPAIITADMRAEYLRLLADEDAAGLATLLARLLADELERAQPVAR